MFEIDDHFLHIAVLSNCLVAIISKVWVSVHVMEERHVISSISLQSSFQKFSSHQDRVLRKPRVIKLHQQPVEEQRLEFKHLAI